MKPVDVLREGIRFRDAVHDPHPEDDRSLEPLSSLVEDCPEMYWARAGWMARAALCYAPATDAVTHNPVPATGRTGEGLER